MAKTEYLSVCPSCSRLNENYGGGWRLATHADKWLIEQVKEGKVPDTELMDWEKCCFCEEVSDEH